MILNTGLSSTGHLLKVLFSISLGTSLPGMCSRGMCTTWMASIVRLGGGCSFVSQYLLSRHTSVVDVEDDEVVHRLF